MLAAGSTEYDSLADGTRIGVAAHTSGINWDNFFGGSFDDAQWVILAFWKIADYKNAHGEDASAYMNSARAIYNLITEQWDDTCGGGVWWSSAKTYKNAITNELFLLTSAQGFKRYGDQTMLQNAQKTWAWR
jgi:predicted alpha-1,6-mannanase (GH76 family)